MPFLYPLLNYLQPGELWPALAALRPMLLASILAGVLALRPSVRPDAALIKAYFTRSVLFWLSAFVLVQAISVYYSGMLSMLHELQFWDNFPIFVAISLLSLRDARALRRYVWGTILGSTVIIFYAIFAAALHSGASEGAAAAYGMYANQNDYSFIIIMVLPFAYLYVRVCRHRWQRVILYAVLLGSLVGVVLSLSRGGILALVLEAALLIWMTTRGTRRVAALAFLVILGLGASIHQFLAREAEDAGRNYTLQDSADSRFELWYAARKEFEAHPVLGVGSRRFSEYAGDYVKLTADVRGKVAHNTYFEVAADTGCLGLGTFCLMLLGIRRLVATAQLADATGDGVIEAQVATLVTFYGIVFRAFFDAKEADWSFYFLIVMAIASSALAQRAGVRARKAVAPAPAAAAAHLPPLSLVYRRR